MQCLVECFIVCVWSVAIERAMAYIDTGELPWDMNLFDANAQQVRTQFNSI